DTNVGVVVSCMKWFVVAAINISGVWYTRLGAATVAGRSAQSQPPTVIVWPTICLMSRGGSGLIRGGAPVPAGVSSMTAYDPNDAAGIAMRVVKSCDTISAPRYQYAASPQLSTA